MKLKIFKITDKEYWVGESKESILEAIPEQTGIPVEEYLTDGIDFISEVPDNILPNIKMTLDELGLPESNFAIELARIQKKWDNGELEMPLPFAGSEW